MDRQRVSSTHLVSVGYDEDSAILEIQFKDGAMYQYSSVPRRVHDGLMTAWSKGSYFDQQIKGVYRYRRVR